MSRPGTGPVLPPKPESHEASRQSTPVGSGFQGTASRPGLDGVAVRSHQTNTNFGQATSTRPSGSLNVVHDDDGDSWLPELTRDKSKQDMAALVGNNGLLNALTHATTTIHPWLEQSHRILAAALAENVDIASRLLEAERRLADERSTTQGQLLSTHALERQWRQKQVDLDTALGPFSPTALYQRLGHGVQEQAMICNALEESFLDGSSEGACATERETADWIRRYRDAKSLYYQRLERKERWDEGRVGGWR